MFNKKPRPGERGFLNSNRELEDLLLVFAVAFATLFGSGCGLLFFHLLADFLLALGADFRTLGAFGFNDFLAANQFDTNRIAPITNAPALMQDAPVAAVPVTLPGRDSIEQAGD